MADPRLEETKPRPDTGDAAQRIGWWRWLKRWMRAHHMTIMTLPDTPHAIALGAAIGMFFGFTPLFTLKTLLAFLITWLCRANKTAAVLFALKAHVIRKARMVFIPKSGLNPKNIPMAEPSAIACGVSGKVMSVM